ncbi:MAG: hypothetical protein JHC95_06600 [Solirubrobacteraceae bacterium]|nr:hypothetical protein [Solirubrobacteraceae bacterium]
MAGRGWFHRPMDGNESPAERWKRTGVDLATFARRSRWVMTTEELLAAGWSQSAIDRHAKSPELNRLFQGVHLYGRVDPTRDELERAALKACGPEAVLSHRSAGARHRLLRWKGDVEVIVPTRRRRRKRLHPRVRALDPRDITIRDGLRVTTLARTLLDLAAVLDAFHLDLAVNEAEAMKKLHLPAVDAAIARAPQALGLGTLETLLRTRRPVTGRLASKLEGRFHRFLRDRGFPPTEHNVPFQLDDHEWVTIDTLFRREWVAVEIDSAVHDTVTAYDRDRRRDRRVKAVHDLPTTRITDTDLDERPDEVERDLRTELARRG